MELEKALEPKAIDTISVQSFGSRYYTSKRQKIEEDYKKLRNLQKKNNIKTFSQKQQSEIDYEIYKPLKQNFKQNLTRKDKMWIAENRSKSLLKNDANSLDFNDGKLKKFEWSMNDALQTESMSQKNTKNKEEISVQEQSKTKLKDFLRIKDKEIKESFKIRDKLTQSLNQIKLEKTNQSQLENNKNQALMSSDQNLNINHNKKDNLDNDQKIQECQDQQINKNEILAILEQYPNMDLQNLDSQNLDYIAHLIGVCACYKCECLTCKCPYQMNLEKPRYAMQNFISTNQRNNYIVQHEQIKDNQNLNINHDTLGILEKKITNHSCYQREYQGVQVPQQGILYQNYNKPTAPHIFKSTYTTAFQNWKYNKNEFFYPIHQISILKNPIQNKTVYQETFKKPDLPKEYPIPQPQSVKLLFKNRFKIPQYVYQSQYREAFQGDYNPKAKIFRPKYFFNNLKDTPAHFGSIYQKMGSDLRLDAEKNCPRKIFSNKNQLKQQIQEYLQT